MAKAMKVAFLTSKGGSGKSTLTLGVAAAAVEAGHKVLVVDADPDGTTSGFAKARQRVGLPPINGLTIVAHPAPDLHKWLPGTVEKAGADFVVVDGVPRSDEALTRSIVAAVDKVLIPVQPSLPDLWRARSVIDVLREAESKNVRRKAAFVLSRVKTGTRISKDFVEVLKSEGLPLLEAGTRDLIAHADAISAAQTILEYEPRGAAAEEIRSIYQAVKEL